MVFVAHTWAYFYLRRVDNDVSRVIAFNLVFLARTYTRQSVSLATDIDIYSKDYPAHVWLMIIFGLLDSMLQTYAYWLMGAMSNSLGKLAVFTGFCE